MRKTKSTTVTRKVLRASARLVQRQPVTTDRRTKGFIYSRIGSLWCGAWYTVYATAVDVASGMAGTRARRLDGLPPRFEALFLLAKLVRSGASGLACRT